MPDWFNNLFSFFRREEFVLVFIVDLIFLIIPDQWLHDGVAAFRAENIGWFVVLLMASLVVTIGLGYQKVVARIDQKRKAQEAEVEQKRKEEMARQKMEKQLLDWAEEFSGLRATEKMIVFSAYYENQTTIKANPRQIEVKNLASLGYINMVGGSYWDEQTFDVACSFRLTKKAKHLMDHYGQELFKEVADLIK